MENETNAEIVKTGDWVLTYLITAIPIVGLVMLFVWAFGNNTNPIRFKTKRNIPRKSETE